MTFKPERFLSQDGDVIDDPLLDYAFGFGIRYAYSSASPDYLLSWLHDIYATRRCPGKHFAEAMLWNFIATILSAFQIKHVKGIDGMDIPVLEQYDNSGIVWYVLVCQSDGTRNRS